MWMTSRLPKEVSWNELTLQTELLFGVFGSKRERRWSQTAWQEMGKEGLTSYEDDDGRFMVMVRLMVLATLYREFCQLAFNVRFWREEETRDWIETRVVNRMRLWEIICPRLHLIRSELDPDYSLVSHVCDLIDEHRGEIVEALFDGYNHNKLALFEDIFRNGYNLEIEYLPMEEDNCFEDYMNRARRVFGIIKVDH